MHEHNYISGSKGMKGENGTIWDGEKGFKGEEGPKGLKGDQGMMGACTNQHFSCLCFTTNYVWCE